MINVIYADLYKMKKSPTLKILLLATIMSTGAMLVISQLITSGKLGDSSLGIGFMFSDANIISIIGAVSASIFICGDFSNRSIITMVSSGTSRLTILTGKTISFFISIAILLAPYALTTGFLVARHKTFRMEAVGVGFLRMITAEHNLSQLGEIILKYLIVMVTLMIVYMAQLSICLPLCVMFRKPAPVISIYYALTFASAQLLTAAATNKTLDGIYSCTPFGGTHTLMTLEVSAADLVKSIAVSISFILVMLFASYRLFKNSEIK